MQPLSHYQMLGQVGSCVHYARASSIPRLARLRTSPQVGTTLPDVSTTDWLKLKPLRLNAIVQIPIEVNHTQITGHDARKK